MRRMVFWLALAVLVAVFAGWPFGVLLAAVTLLPGRPGQTDDSAQDDRDDCGSDGGEE